MFYAGFEDPDHTFLIYPAGAKTNRNFTSNGQPYYYDPTIRSWYINGKARENYVVVSSPYMYAEKGQIGLTFSKALIGVNKNSFNGVVGIDVTIMAL